MNVVRNLAAWIVRSLLWLRYDITLIGKEKLLQRDGVLILPNHPGELDPVIVFSHLWSPMQPRGMAVEDFYYMPVLHYLMQMLRVIPMPNMYGGIGSYKKFRVRKALKHAADCLNEGSNVVIYPSGRLMRSTREEVRAASGVYDILSQVQQKRILLVRTRGLMGSSFSWVAWQETPPLFRCLLIALKHLLMNLIFFSPRRKVVIEFVESPPDFPYDGTKMEMNRYLDNWYNKGGEEQIVLVPQTIWSKKAFEHRQSTLPEESSVEITPEVRQKVISEIARRRDMDVSEIQDSSSLSSQIGFDSLELAGMIAWLEEEFHAYEGKAEELRNVYDLQVAAAGGATAYALTGDNAAPKAWHEPARDVAVTEPDTNTSVHMNFLKVSVRNCSKAMASQNARRS